MFLSQSVAVSGLDAHSLIHFGGYYRLDNMDSINVDITWSDNDGNIISTESTVSYTYQNIADADGYWDFETSDGGSYADKTGLGKNKTKQNKTKQNKTKQNKTKEMCMANRLSKTFF